MGACLTVAPVTCARLNAGHASQGGSTTILPGEWGTGRERATKRRATGASDAIEVFGAHASAILCALQPGAQGRPENRDRNGVEKFNGQRIHHSNPADDLATEMVVAHGHGREDGWMVASVTPEGELDPRARSLRHEELECLGIHPMGGWGGGPHPGLTKHVTGFQREMAQREMRTSWVSKEAQLKDETALPGLIGRFELSPPTG